MRWRFVFSEMAIGLRRNLSMTIATVLTIFIALTGLGAAWLMHAQTGTTRDYWFGKIEVSVYLDKQVTQAQRNAILQQLQALPQVRQVYYESKQQAFVRFKELFGATDPGLAREVTDPNQLPESYRVKLKNPKEFDIIRSAVQLMPGVDQVVTQSQALKKLFKLLDGLQNTMFGVAFVVLLAAILLIFNNVRLAAFSRRRETGIMRLVGASDLYIQAPFVLEMAAAALVGGLLSVGAMFAIKWIIIDRGIAPAFGAILKYIDWSTVAGMIPFIVLGGLLIATVTAVGTLQRYLRV